MYTLEPVVKRVIPTNAKVIFDTNAYRNFALRYLQNNNDFLPTILHLKNCEEGKSFVPSTNLISVLELYQHLKIDDPAEAICRKAIGFSFIRSYINDNLKFQPLFEVDIASKFFNKCLVEDYETTNYFLRMHRDFCTNSNKLTPSDKVTYIDNANLLLHRYKERFYESILENLRRLFPDYDTNTKKLPQIDVELFKKKFIKADDIVMYVDLGTSLYKGFIQKLGLDDSGFNKHELITEMIFKYQPALYSYITMWKKFVNNGPKSSSSFSPNKNDLIDSLILFSIIPDENIYLVTDEKKIHKIFQEINRPDLVFDLDTYLKHIGF